MSLEVGVGGHLRIIMESRDPSRNQARSYTIEAGADLFGDFVVSTTFGRIGSKGQTRRLAFASPEAAIPTLRKILSQRLKISHRRTVPYAILSLRDPTDLMTGCPELSVAM
jgi:predicted DNA-binding WGR domain protein